MIYLLSISGIICSLIIILTLSRIKLSFHVIMSIIAFVALISSFYSIITLKNDLKLLEAQIQLKNIVIDEQEECILSLDERNSSYFETIQEYQSQEASRIDEIEALREITHDLSEVQHEFNVEVSHYTDTGNPMANGEMPYYGAYAGPDFLPLGTQFKIIFSDGTEEYGTIKDRGATWAIRVFDRDEPPKVCDDTVMRIDRFMPDLTKDQIRELGVMKAKIIIIDWGE